MTVATIGIDIGKSVFHLVGLDRRGKLVLRRRLSRPQLLRLTAQLRPCLVGMEPCCGAHHLGHGWPSKAIRCGWSRRSSFARSSNPIGTTTLTPKPSAVRACGLRR